MLTAVSYFIRSIEHEDRKARCASSLFGEIQLKLNSLGADVCTAYINIFLIHSNGFVCAVNFKLS